MLEKKGGASVGIKGVKAAKGPTVSPAQLLPDFGSLPDEEF